MSHIFVSYASEDRDRIMPVVRALEATGWSVFWDRTIPVGKTWREIIGTEIEACRCMVVIWSATSINKRWVCEEASEGERRGVLTPVLIDDILPPIGFRSIQAAKLGGWDGKVASAEFDRLIKDISHMLGTLPLKIGEQKQHADLEAGKRCAAFGWPPMPASLRFGDLLSKLKPVRKLEHPWDLGTNAYRVRTIDWQVNCLRLIEQEDEYTGDGYLARDSLQTYIKNLERERAECGQGGLWQRASSIERIDRIDEELAEARVLLRKMNELQAEAIDHLPKEFEGFPDHLRRLATELLMKDDTKADLEISQFVIDNARSRVSRLPERTTSQKTAKQEKLENINELARRLGLY